MTRSLMEVPADRGAAIARRSSMLCATAVLVYDDLLRRVPELEPDMGLGQRYESGRRTLLRRGAARSFIVGADLSAAADALLATARAVEGCAVIDAIETLPVELLAILERRRHGVSNATRHHRRWTDALLPRPSPPAPRCAGC